MENTIHAVMKTVLIGQELKYVKQIIPVEQHYTVKVKKSQGVTKKQLEEGNPRFVKTITQYKNIGKHIIYETSMIVDVIVEYGDWDSANSLAVVLENGYRIALEVDTLIQNIDKKVIMFK